MTSKIISRFCRASSRSGIRHFSCMVAPTRQEQVTGIFNGYNPSTDAIVAPFAKLVPSLSSLSSQPWVLEKYGCQKFGFSSTASPEPKSKESSHASDEQKTGVHCSQSEANDKSNETEHSPHASLEAEAEEAELSIDDLVKLVAEKEEQLKLKHKEIEKMQDKILRSYAEMENVIDRTKREAENSKKFAIQSFAKSLLDVADNLGRASSVVKESYSKIDASKDSVGAVPLLKTLLEGVEMTDKQLGEVFRKFGVEKFDPTNEHFDPHRHLAVFQMPDPSKPPGTIAAVLKAGYMLYDRVIRPAEVGVIQARDEACQNPET